MNHIQISIEAAEREQEILISALSDLGATGFEQTDTNLLAYFDEESFASYDVNEILKAYNFQIQTIQQQNWNAVWESNFQPVVVDDFCAIRADFHQPIAGVEHEIIITPKMSFGTGHHATTFMMMQQMREIDFANKTVFDFGTGTGILAILAEKLGAQSIYAIDVDDWSIENAQENFQRNNCSTIKIHRTSILPTQQGFDIVLANINRNVLLASATDIHKVVKRNGLLLLSGLLKEDEKDIVNAFNVYDFKLIRKKDKLNWISLLFTN